MHSKPFELINKCGVKRPMPAAVPPGLFQAAGRALPSEIEKHIASRKVLLSNTEKDILELHPHDTRDKRGGSAYTGGGATPEKSCKLFPSASEVRSLALHTHTRALRATMLVGSRGRVGLVTPTPKGHLPALFEGPFHAQLGEWVFVRWIGLLEWIRDFLSGTGCAAWGRLSHSTKRLCTKRTIKKVAVIHPQGT
jgi:hypothetical protein